MTRHAYGLAALVSMTAVLAACAAGAGRGDVGRGERTDAAALEQRNKDVARRVVTEILSGGNFELANELYSPDFVNHGQTRDIGLAEDQAAARGWKQAFPDLVMTPEMLIAEGDLVAVHWAARGTNTGTGNGLPATGKTLQGRGITIWKIVDGRITDEWSAFDQLAIMKQLGLMPSAGP